ncbi:hypothetical protein C8J56DRAFT_357642 [Mycena floridula]|nr:hypothetical protein C8J56DRAFT_357642 [Mycena floridula]
MLTTTTTTLFLLLLCVPSDALVVKDRRRSWSLWPRASTRSVPPAGYYDPTTSGGSLLTQADSVPGLGEPINMIISGNSDAEILVDQEPDGGLRNYFLSLHFSSECLGQHIGAPQRANLGDGHGYVNESAVIRYNYFDPTLGACTESVKGGDHFRYWVQNGDSGNSGAIFMACSYEMPIAQGHNIVSNGYNLGRDYIVGNLTNTTVPTLQLNSSVTWSGSTWSNGWTYQTDVIYVPNLLQNTSSGINHGDTVSTPQTNAVDGLVAVMTAKITGRPPSSAAWRSIPQMMYLLPPILMLLTSVLFPSSWI